MRRSQRNLYRSWGGECNPEIGSSKYQGYYDGSIASYLDKFGECFGVTGYSKKFFGGYFKHPVQEKPTAIYGCEGLNPNYDLREVWKDDNGLVHDGRTGSLYEVDSPSMDPCELKRLRGTTEKPCD